MKRTTFFIRFAMVSVFVASGFGVFYAPKTQALGPGDEICRAVVIVDRSDSVKQAGQINNVTREVRELPPQINHSKIQVAFWSFAGWSRYVSSDDNDWNINRANQNFNWPWHGYVSTTSPAPGSWNSAVNTMKSYQGDTLFKRNTYYDWAFGYTNGGNGDLPSTAYNPQPNAALHATGIPAASDVLVFTTDGEPDQRGNERRIVAERYLSDSNHPRSILGAVIPADFSLNTGNNPVNLMVNGSRYDSTNVFRVSTNYSNFASSVATLVKRGCDYRLTPTVSLNDIRTDPSQNITVSGNVNNDSINRKSDYTEWRLTRIAYPPNTITNTIPFSSLNGRSITSSVNPSGGPFTLDPCAAIPRNGLNHASAAVDCNRAGWKGTNTLFPSGDTPINRSDTMSSEVGSIICYFLSVKPPGFDEANNTWSHSRLACSIVAKSPHIHIQGGDLRVINTPATSGVIHSGTSTAPSGTYGSWVEYGVFSTGLNNLVSSASTGAASNVLTFRNTPAPRGNFTPLVSSDIASYFPGGGPCASIDITSSGQRDYNCTGDILIGGDMNPGASVTIKTTGKVVITGNITKPTVYSNIKDVPQLVIIANRIHIDPAVTRVDAWLIASNEIDTCQNAAGTQHPGNRVSANDCNQPLVINGPVKTNALRLFRTAGAGASDPSLAAETFNFRPDAYSWLYSRSNSTLKLRTNAIHELPPRY